MRSRLLSLGVMACCAGACGGGGSGSGGAGGGAGGGAVMPGDSQVVPVPAGGCGSWLACGAGCFDPDRDPMNCGGCAVQCGYGATCVKGTCQCPAGQTLNGCGGCGTQCALVDGLCQGSNCTCGGAMPLVCGGHCADGATSDSNCGACGTQCPTDLPTCRGGSCGCAGLSPMMCNGACVDLAADPYNCGGCGHACPAPYAAFPITGPAWECTAGTCTCVSNIEPAVCGGFCTDISDDSSNCSACGHACAAGCECVSNQCWHNYGTPSASHCG
jgi:hypothetical protein